MAAGPDFDPKYVRFLVLFNRDRDYYGCHDVMEELWLEEGRGRFWQGLLQVAVGLHHWGNENRAGAAKLLRAALAKLDGCADLEAGIDVKRLREDAAAALRLLDSWLGEAGAVPHAAEAGPRAGSGADHGSARRPPEPVTIDIRIVDRRLAERVAAEMKRPPGDESRADGE
ncbi:MAG: hypothetical protein A9Z00_15175 [Thermobacillus sp. ZCTH02-B1]|uniref:DUF309 domain-containing protein n=1 Tax=Thermobacillus sp. ZCTH02-B1 TaxID=1858795 RepID=UPI000B581EEF|nr:DUF309 domain-containing protein [Thermobacillus sp. ZCTH02-B1]OUM94439.1 MAG: hypothetical protein A9Z00_15175 [Thermobacillus sp. ZCTH02-B1]